MTGALLDTSVVIASGLDSGQIPSSSSISIVTIGELHAGVRLARSERTRQLRRHRLEDVRRLFVPLPIDEDVAESYGEVLAFARNSGRIVKATDLFIIATAAAFRRALFTLDHAQGALASEFGLTVSVAQ